MQLHHNGDMKSSSSTSSRDSLETLRKGILYWYEKNQRDLPWRSSRDPYNIWLSEIILQQTRVQQGLEYYLRFAEEFPTVHDLAEADEQVILKHWQGLGYYSRARNLHKAAKVVSTEFHGIFPSDYNSLLKLPGIGPYTAGAIASIAFEKVVPVVDGNVFRVLSRLFDIGTPINSTQGSKEFRRLAQELIDPGNPGAFNQGLMELGALVCTPASPNCLSCPVAEICAARIKGTQSDLPVKTPKRAPKRVWFNYFVITDGHRVIIRSRSEGIWQNLFDFPGEESEKPNGGCVDTMMDQLSGLNARLVRQESLDHVLTHKKIRANFHVIEVDALPEQKHDEHKVKMNDFETFPVPRLIENFWNIWKESSVDAVGHPLKNA